MRLITRRTLAASAAARWRLQYPPTTTYPHDADVAEKLDAIGPAPHPDDVDRIVGNSSRTDPGRCHECGATPGELVEVGEPPDHESSTARLCAKCLLAAMILIEP